MAKKTTTPKAEDLTPVTAHEVQVQNEVDLATEERLVALHTLQRIDSQIDKIQIIRGELPQAIEDLEDEVAGLNTRIENLTTSIKEYDQAVKTRKNEIETLTGEIKDTEEKMNHVKNNREFESLNKEAEFKNLEIQLRERKNRDADAKIKELQKHMEAAQTLRTNREADLQMKREELEDIIKETEKDEQVLLNKSKEQEQHIDERYLTAYKRIRKAARNGLAVVAIDRDACGGCFSKIPPQRQTEIKMHKKVIVCEYCGRILVDSDIVEKSNKRLEE
ncbi:MAG: hypothetical protein AUK63_641 [bacterium P3]|nr:MAG: hypothetical protein AUK63_641 [bacterium P3]KWW42124.1 MAG: hypothetical protein F083_463 [bacterium F083]